jgi:putative Ca2+/H+ antiporter (TMEM165/GDT1 family)
MAASIATMLVKDVQALWTAFVKSLLVILASEIGDKTFFIAAIMAMRNPRGQVCARSEVEHMV